MRKRASRDCNKGKPLGLIWGSITWYGDSVLTLVEVVAPGNWAHTIHPWYLIPHQRMHTSSNSSSSTPLQPIVKVQHRLHTSASRLHPTLPACCIPSLSTTQNVTVTIALILVSLSLEPSSSIWGVVRINHTLQIDSWIVLPPENSQQAAIAPSQAWLLPVCIRMDKSSSIYKVRSPNKAHAHLTE